VLVLLVFQLLQLGQHFLPGKGQGGLADEALLAVQVFRRKHRRRRGRAQQKPAASLHDLFVPRHR